MITVVGVGIEKGDVTEKGMNAIKRAARVFSRVKLWIPSEVVGGDAEDYAQLDEMIAEAVTAAGDAVYLSLGDGYTDSAVAAIARRTEVKIIPGVSEYRGRVPFSRVTFLSAYELRPDPSIDTSAPLVVYGIDDRLVAGAVKLAICELYGDEKEVTFSSGTKSARIKAYEIDRMTSYKGAAVAVEGVGLTEKSRYGFADLMAVMERLTADDGCPWDKAQTHESIRINMIEEAYEAADAIDKGSVEDMREEIGDVLLQAVFHCNIAERKGEFDTLDVTSELVNKLVTRHTHIFGANNAADPDAALGFWEQAKAKEKHASTLSEQLGRLPDAFPSLLYAAKVCKKCVKAGGVLPVEDIKAKLSALIEGGVCAKNAGEALLLCCALAALSGADPEAELSRRARETAEAFSEADENGELAARAAELL